MYKNQSPFPHVSSFAKIKVLIIVFVICFAMLFCSCGRLAQQAPSDEPLQSDQSPSPAPEAPDEPAIDTDNILFWDNFQDGDTRGWDIESGWTTQQDGDKYWFENVNESRAWVPKGLEWTDDYALKTMFIIQQGTLGLSFNASNAGRYLVVIQKDRLSLLKEVGEQRTILAQCAAPAFNRLHVISMGIKNGNVQVYIDKEPWLSINDADPLSGGAIMLGTTEDTICFIDNVLVNKIIKPLPDIEPVADQFSEDEQIMPEEIEDVIAELPDDSNEFPDLPEENNPEEIPAPVISFTINEGQSASIDHGEDVYIEWQVDNASLVMYQSNIVDASGTAVETPEGNTEYMLTVTDIVGSSQEYTVDVNVTQDSAAAEGIDIAVKNVTLEEPHIAGQPISVNVTIKNKGSDDANAFTVVWYPNSDGVVGLSWDIDWLPAGDELTIRDVFAGYPDSGSHTWSAVADTENELEDANRDNNEKTGTVNIDESVDEDEPMADLVMRGVGMEEPYVEGQPISISLTIKNIGDTAASGFEVEWFADDEGIPDIFWTIVCLAPGVELTLDDVFAGYLSSGTYTWRARVNATLHTAESNTGNNSKSGTIEVLDEFVLVE